MIAVLTNNHLPRAAGEVYTDAEMIAIYRAIFAAYAGPTRSRATKSFITSKRVGYPNGSALIRSAFPRSSETN